MVAVVGNRVQKQRDGGWRAMVGMRIAMKDHGTKGRIGRSKGCLRKNEN